MGGLPETAREFISRFDCNIHVAPFSFEIEIEEEYVS